MDPISKSTNVRIRCQLMSADLPQTPLSESAKSAYPYLELEPSSELEERELKAYPIGEGDQAWLLFPELGGRLIGANNLEDLRGTGLRSAAGGPRGSHLPEGLRVVLGTGIRRTDLAQVPCRVRTDEDGAEAWVWTNDPGTNLSAHLKVAAPQRNSAVEFQLRLLNESGTMQASAAGLLFSDCIANQTLTYPGCRIVQGPKARYLVRRQGIEEGGIYELEGGTLISPFAKPTSLAPYEHVTWSVEVIRLPVDGAVLAASPEFVLIEASNGLQLFSVGTANQHRIGLKSEAGEWIAAHFDLRAGLNPLPVEGRFSQISILDDLKRPVFEADLYAPNAATISSLNASNTADSDLTALSDAEVLNRTLSGQDKVAATFEWASRLGRRGQFEEAAQAWQSHLLYNGDNPIAWLNLARCRRLAEQTGNDEDSPSELLNAHYLAPLHPDLVVEAFLSAGGNKESLALLEDVDPDALLGAYDHLIQSSPFGQAGRLLEAMLQLIDCPMVRILAAAQDLTANNDRVNAVSHLQKANQHGFRPPFPWRKSEWNAIELVNRAFPENEATKQFLALREG